jgi:predicted  nucleic acid-binding Zn-ribbon protein
MDPTNVAILIIDRHGGYAPGIVRMLKAAGYRVQTATTERAVQDLTARERFNIIVKAGRMICLQTVSAARLMQIGSGMLASALTELEKRHEIARLRSIIPASILGHHDRMLQRGKRSIVPAVNGICSACHLRLPSGHAARLQGSQDLEVCDNCGAFIYFEPACSASGTCVPAEPKPAKAKRKRVKGAVR